MSEPRTVSVTVEFLERVADVLDRAHFSINPAGYERLLDLERDIKAMEHEVRELAETVSV